MLAALGFIVGEQVEDFPLFPHVVGAHLRLMGRGACRKSICFICRGLLGWETLGASASPPCKWAHFNLHLSLCSPWYECYALNIFILRLLGNSAV